jgi:hypothetical protein
MVNIIQKRLAYRGQMVDPATSGGKRLTCMTRHFLYKPQCPIVIVKLTGNISPKFKSGKVIFHFIEVTSIHERAK